MKSMLSVVLITVAAFGADAPQPTQPLTDSQKLALRNTQVEMQAFVIQQAQIQQRIQALQKTFQDQFEADLKSHHLDPKEWTLDKDLNLVPIKP